MQGNSFKKLTNRHEGFDSIINIFGNIFHFVPKLKGVTRRRDMLRIYTNVCSILLSHRFLAQCKICEKLLFFKFCNIEKNTLNL